ncbi:MAG: MFS transporter, partial [Oscillospiraceae bacterium]
SKEYIDSKMLGMLLVFIVSFVVALIMIFELLKLPDAMFERLSKTFRTTKKQQADIVSPMLRLGSFIAYTGMYVGIPFSSVLILQWNKTIFDLPIGFVASIPMTAELLATMICSLFCLPLYRRMNLKVLFTLSALISAAANVMCFFANSPEQLIIYRFISGIGFAGIKYSFNSFVSLGSISQEYTTNNLASLNSGLLGGITCGGTLGAVIAGSISVQMSYFIAGIFIVAFAMIVMLLGPWKLFTETAAAENNTSDGKRTNALQFVFNPAVLRYMLLVALPMNFGLMFVVAFFPGFVSSLGLPEVTISYGYLLNGLVGIYLGPVLLKSLSARIGRTACVIMSLLIAAASIFMLNINIPIVIILLSVSLLGLFDGFGTPATSDYYVNMPAVKNTGVSQGLAMLNVVGSIIQTFSPVVYSVILTAGATGLNFLAAAFVACAVLFLVTLGLDREKKTKADVTV